MSFILRVSFIVFSFFLFCSPVYTQVAFTSSNLPIVVLTTNGQWIPDAPKIIANMGIIWNSSGQRNSLKDPMNNYNGKIGIEIRGSSSQMFPKKSYGLETRSGDGASLDVSLLGMPEENDWILYAPYTDKSMIRDVFSYTLDASFGRYSPRCRYVELVLNGSYEGVYVLMEKIKRDKNRVDVAKLTVIDNAGENLTGGYIIKIDKTTGSGGEGWYSDYSNIAGSTYYQYDYPGQDVLTTTQKAYIQTYVRTMEKSLYLEKYTGTENYHEFLNDSSCIDFMIINELAKNVDGYRLSSYLFKDKNGLLNCGPIWDFNLTYGNVNYCNGWMTNDFEYNVDLGGDFWQNPFWWKKLLKDLTYVTKLKRRWAMLRKKELSDLRINFVTDSLINLISEAQVRNYQRWPILGTYVWPNYFIGANYTSELNWMKDWIKKRLVFLDQQWPYNFTETIGQLAANSYTIFPNPFHEKLTIQLSPTISGDALAEIFSTDGSLIQKQRISIVNGQINLGFSEMNSLIPGLYMVRITRNDQILLTEKVMKIN
ncbi:MAG: CotH kinase family protein [Bacteroidia bacterium]